MLRIHLNVLKLRKFTSSSKGNFNKITKYFDISDSEAESLTLKRPVINKLTESHIKSLVNTLHGLGYQKDVLLQDPKLFGILPITLKFRHKVLEECGIIDVSARHLSSYLPLMKRKTIGELKKAGEIPNSINVELRLASYLTTWPTALTTSVGDDVNDMSLYGLRLKILQQYLELLLELSSTEFYRGIETYPTIKHRPLQVINETLNILLSQIMMPLHKIKSNLYLLHADPENLKQIIYNFRSIGGIDIKEVIRLHPGIAVKKYSTLFEIRKILQEYNISHEAQVRCFNIYAMSPETVKERIEKAKTVPEFNALYNHPRFLKIILYNKTATKRLMKLYSSNKKCVSLNALSGSSDDFQAFEKAPGDRLGKGKDLVFCVSQCLGGNYSMKDVRNVLNRHPFWISIPIIRVKYVYEQLSVEFAPDDIYHNCAILLYPWSEINSVLQLLSSKNQKRTLFPRELQIISKLDNKQKLSLVLYLLEKNHYFTGNGVWTDEKNKGIDTDTEKTVDKSLLDNDKR